MTLNVLLIEDDEADAEAASRHLKDWARISGQTINITQVCDLDSALLKISTQMYQYIFTDLSVPPHRGTEIIQLLKPVSSGIPIIAYSGHLAAHRIAETLDAGASNFIPKSAGRESFGAAMVSAERQNALESAMTTLSRQILDMQSLLAELRVQSLSQSEISQISKTVAQEAVTTVFRSLGIDPRDHKDVRETHSDLVWLRDFRKTLNTTSARIRLTVISILVAGILGALWLGIKGTIQGK